MKLANLSMALMGFWVLGACSMQPNDTTEVTFHLENAEEDRLGNNLGPTGLWPMGIPASVSGFSCLAINIIGNGIAPAAGANPGRAGLVNDYLSGGPKCAYAGIVSSGFTPGSVGSGKTITMAVPSGTRIIAQLIGIVSTNGCPESPSELVNQTGATHFLLADDTPFISGPTTVNLQANYQTSDPIPVECEVRVEPFSLPSCGAGARTYTIRVTNLKAGTLSSLSTVCDTSATPAYSLSSACGSYLTSGTDCTFTCSCGGASCPDLHPSVSGVVTHNGTSETVVVSDKFFGCT